MSVPDVMLCKAVRDLAARPLLRPQMHVLTRRLLEIDTSEQGNHYRAYVYNQRRREIEGPSSFPRWWVRCNVSSYLLPLGSPERAFNYIYR